MKVFAWVHLYAPDHCAGAEMMLHEILVALQARGHHVAVACDASSVENFEGVPIIPRRSNALDTKTERCGLVAGSDIVITHLDRTREVIDAVARSRPIVHLVHNDRQLRFHRVRPVDAQLVVANSRWIERGLRWRGRTIVVPPPVHAERYRVPRDGAEAITLVNLSEAKGADLFWKLAALMPRELFIGVVGGYGPQIIPRVIPSNVTIIEHGPDIRSVYNRTRILLCPSSYESWGRVGIEAAASGIPTIAHPTPGLLESLRGSGTFVDRDDVDGWVQEIATLDDPAIYAARSRQALLRSDQLDPTRSIDLLEQRMLELTEG